MFFLILYLFYALTSQKSVYSPLYPSDPHIVLKTYHTSKSGAFKELVRKEITYFNESGKPKLILKYSLNQPNRLSLTSKKELNYLAGELHETDSSFNFNGRLWFVHKIITNYSRQDCILQETSFKISNQGDTTSKNITLFDSIHCKPSSEQGFYFYKEKVNFKKIYIIVDSIEQEFTYHLDSIGNWKFVGLLKAIRNNDRMEWHRDADPIMGNFESKGSWKYDQFKNEVEQKFYIRKPGSADWTLIIDNKTIHKYDKQKRLLSSYIIQGKELINTLIKYKYSD